MPVIDYEMRLDVSDVSRGSAAAQASIEATTKAAQSSMAEIDARGNEMFDKVVERITAETELKDRAAEESAAASLREKRAKEVAWAGMSTEAQKATEAYEDQVKVVKNLSQELDQLNRKWLDTTGKTGLSSADAIAHDIDVTRARRNAATGRLGELNAARQAALGVGGGARAEGQLARGFASGAMRSGAMAAGMPIPYGVGAAGLGIAAGSVVGLAAVGVIAKGISSHMELAKTVVALRREVGGATATLGAYVEAGREFGVSGEKMAEALKNVVKAARTQPATFKSIGVEVLDASGKVKDSTTLTMEALRALSGYADGADKAAIMTQLFGSAADDMGNIVDAGKGKIDGMTASLAAAGPEMEKRINDAARMERNIQRLGKATEDAARFWTSFIVEAVAGPDFSEQDMAAARKQIDSENFQGTPQQKYIATQKRASKIAGENRAGDDAAKAAAPVAAAVDATTSALMKMGEAGDLGFRTLSQGASATLQSMSAMPAVLAQIEAKYKVFSRLGLLGTGTNEAINAAQFLGFTPDAMESLFDVLNGVVGQRSKEVLATARARLYAGIGDTLQKVLVQDLEDKFDSLTERIQSIDEQLQDIDKKTGAAERTFDESESQKALRAREEETIFLAKRPSTDTEELEKRRGKLLKERADLTGQLAKTTTDLADARTKLAAATAIFAAEEAKHAAAVAAAQAIEDARQARLHPEQNGLDPRGLSGGVNLPSSATTRHEIVLEVLDRGGTLNSMTREAMLALMHEVFDDAETRVRAGVPPERAAGQTKGPY